MTGVQGLELLGTIVGILVAVGGGITVWVKLNNQIAVLQDRSDHDVGRDDSDHDGRDEQVAELKRQARRNEDRIAELERALEREREERADDNRRHAREVAYLNEQLQQVLRDLANARQRYRPDPIPPSQETP